MINTETYEAKIKPFAHPRNGTHLISETTHLVLINADIPPLEAFSQVLKSFWFLYLPQIFFVCFRAAWQAELGEEGNNVEKHLSFQTIDRLRFRKVQLKR